MSGKCTVPPAGWWCSREAGHEGPCAARPNQDDYRGWTIRYDPPPIPGHEFDWQATGPNYDASYEGEEDGWVDNGEKAHAATREELIAEIDEWIEAHEGDRSCHPQASPSTRTAPMDKLDTIEEIARGLTEEQRFFIVGCFDEANDTAWAQGMTDAFEPIPECCVNEPWGWRLTELGQQVRTHLQSRQP